MKYVDAGGVSATGASTVGGMNRFEASAVTHMLVVSGAQRLAPPVERPGETRAFFRDPDGHRFEISELT